MNSRHRQLLARSAAILVGLAGLAATPASLAVDKRDDRWVGAWSAAPAPLNGAGQYQDQTLRLIVHTSIAGSQVRIRISNAFGTESLVIGAAHVALRKAGASFVPGTDRALSFSGNPSFTIPAGALAVSDPVYLTTPALTDLAVSIYLPVLSTANTTHIFAQQTSYLAKSAGDFTSAADLPGADTTGEWDFLTGVDVTDAGGGEAIATVGDSITDGLGSTPDTNRRWPDILATRLQARRGLRQFAILNQGITGNRVLHPAPPGLDFFGPAGLARFDRDVLGQAGVKYLIVLLGLNDFAQVGVIAPDSEQVSASEVIAGYLQFITRAHERGIVVYGCTLMPFENSAIAPNFYSSEKEANRQAVNEWIRTSGAYDAVIDFDKAVRDPAHPRKILAAYDSGDHTHPNDAGYKAMAQAIDLDLFRSDDAR